MNIFYTKKQQILNEDKVEVGATQGTTDIQHKVRQAMEMVYNDIKKVKTGLNEIAVNEQQDAGIALDDIDEVSLDKDDSEDTSMGTDNDNEINDVVMVPGRAVGQLAKKSSVQATYHTDSAKSKYASASVAVNMVVDKPLEMMKLSTLHSRTQEKFKAFDAKLQTGSRLSGLTGGVKAGDKRMTTTRNAHRAQ